MDDDIAGDDEIGACCLNLKNYNLTEGSAEIDEVIDNKKIEGLLSRKARIHLDVSYEP